jgi:hypothetical protein
MSRRDTATPSLSALSFILRNPELWPEGFEFDWWNCRTCAMGLAASIWGDVRDAHYADDIKRMFRIPQREVEEIFCHWTDEERDPTPADVADKIDEYLARSR